MAQELRNSVGEENLSSDLLGSVTGACELHLQQAD